jgi:signal transduction histidine kinase
MSTVVDELRSYTRFVPRGVTLFAAVAAVVLVVAGLRTNWFPWADGIRFSQFERWASLLGLLVVATVPWVALRSTAFSVVVGLSPLVLLLTGASTFPWMMYSALLAAGVVSVTVRPRTAFAPFVASMVPVLGYVTQWWGLAVPGGGQVYSSGGRKSFVEFGVYGGFTVVTVVVGFLVRASSEREQVRGARAEEVEQESAVVAERARLARDLHDVVAHHISLIAVRAETAPYTLQDLPDDAKAVLEEIAGDARRSLDELRAVLGVLRRSDDTGARSPLPTMADLPELIDRSRSAGDTVAVAGLNHAIAIAEVPATRSYVAYRVVQEALTNARRHAPQAPVSIVVAADHTGAIDITVTNPTTDTGATPAGRGLVGIRERVEALNGTFAVERASGSHTLRVTLPGTPHTPPTPLSPESDGGS